MSFIHEALKKAQKEKDGRNRKYDVIVSTPGYKPSFFSGRALWSTFFLVISLAFAAYLWLPSKETEAPNPEPVGPEAIPQPESRVSAVALYEEARLLQNSGRFQEAERLYKKTLNLDPDHVYALNNLGVIHIHDKNYPAALAFFAKATRLKPDYVDSYYNLSCIHALEGKVSQSLVHLKKAISLDQSVKEWAQRDRDLQNLRGVPEFEKIIRGGVTSQ
jgi:tetratricopeptide (TPR) repeat protein